MALVKCCALKDLFGLLLSELGHQLCLLLRLSGLRELLQLQQLSSSRLGDLYTLQAFLQLLRLRLDWLAAVQVIEPGQECCSQNPLKLSCRMV